MKKILKEGNPKIRKFSCETCKCVFLADITEYRILLNDEGVSVSCPYCKNPVYANFKNAPLYIEK